MPQPPVLYVSDLDGTLLGADSLVSGRSAALIRSAVADGALFTVATARTPATLSTLLADVPLSAPAIVMTGAALWDRATGLYSHPVFMPEVTARELVDIYRAEKLPAFVYTLADNRLVIYHIGPMSPNERAFVAERDKSVYKHFELLQDGDSLLPERLDNVLLFYSMQPDEVTLRVYDRISGRADCNPVYYHDIFGPSTAIMEVFAAGASKAAAMERVKEIAGARSTAVFGDNVNDLPMMQAADLAVAVGNAIPEVQQQADIVIGPNTADSVAGFIADHTPSPADS